MNTPWKLRFAPHIGLTSLDTPLFKHSAGSDDPVAQIDHVADLGFAGIEDNLLKLRSPVEQERIGAALARRGLEMGCFVGNADAWNAPLWGRDDDAARQKLRADLDSSIAAAARVGGRYLTTISGRDASTPLGCSTSAWSRT
jgi:hydroxypyruvate isomerase